MATRLYLSGNPSNEAVTPDAGWEKTTGFIRRRLAQIRPNQNSFASTTLSANGTNGNDTLLAQWISEPLDANQSIGGGGATVKGQARVRETAAGSDSRTQVIIYVIQSDLTTVRGTLLAMDTAALSSEWSTSVTNRKVPRGGAVATTLVNAQAGDRIVVEVGARQHATLASNYDISVGDTSSTDLAEDETQTTANNPWIEFSDTITFDNEARVSQVALQVAVLPDTQKARVSQVAVQVAISNYIYVGPSHNGRVRWID